MSEPPHRSEEHTSELQSLAYLVCRLLLEKKKQPTATCPGYGDTTKQKIKDEVGRVKIQISSRPSSFILPSSSLLYSGFFFNDTATTEIYTLSLHDALPISTRPRPGGRSHSAVPRASPRCAGWRSEEHTSELQSLAYLVCRLLLEKKNQ